MCYNYRKSWQKACGHWYWEIYRYKIWIKLSCRVHNNYRNILGCLQAGNPISLKLAFGSALLSQYNSSCKYGFIWISQWSGLCKYRTISLKLFGLKVKVHPLWLQGTAGVWLPLRRDWTLLLFFTLVPEHEGSGLQNPHWATFCANFIHLFKIHLTLVPLRGTFLRVRRVL